MDKIITIKVTEKEHNDIKKYAKRDINSVRGYTKKIILEHINSLLLKETKKDDETTQEFQELELESKRIDEALESGRSLF